MEPDQGELTLIEHLLELRSRLIKAIIAVVACLVVLVPFARPLYTAFSAPLVARLPEGSQMIAIDVASPENLAAKRGYVVVAAFAIAMLITPPDMISQTLLALPVWGLYELGIVFSRMLLKPKQSVPNPGAE